MNIILLDPGNSHLLDNVAVDVFDHDIKPSELRAFLGCPRHCMLLAVDDGQVVGMISAVEFFHPDKSPQLWINEIGVTPAKRNQKIGRRMVQAMLDIALKRGCVSAWLGTDQDNFAARRCFDALTDRESPQIFALYEWDLANGNATEQSVD